MSAVGFPYFSRFVPEGEEGRYAGAFFSARAIATTAALPAAGLLIAATGSYRALLAMGAVGLAGLVPLARAERRRESVTDAAVALPPVERLAAVIPVYRSDRAAEVAAGALRHAELVVLVDDGNTAEIAAGLEDVARHERVRLVRMGLNRGKGTAVAAGVDVALAAAADAVIVLDADGQHPPDLIPAFLAAVRGTARSRRRPPARLHHAAAAAAANAVSSWALSLVVRRACATPRTACACSARAPCATCRRLPGRYEAETLHLKALSAAGGRSPGCRCRRSTRGDELVPRGRVHAAGGRAVLAPATRGRDPVRGVLAEWLPRIGLAMLLAWTVAAALPLLSGLDEQPLPGHQRSRRRPRVALPGARPARPQLPPARRRRHAGRALQHPEPALRRRRDDRDAVRRRASGRPRDAGRLQMALDRPAPEEALGADVLRSHDRHWSHIPSSPSGHLVVTSALVAAAAAMAPPSCAPSCSSTSARSPSRA